MLPHFELVPTGLAPRAVERDLRDRATAVDHARHLTADYGTVHVVWLDQHGGRHPVAKVCRGGAIHPETDGTVLL